MKRLFVAAAVAAGFGVCLFFIAQGSARAEKKYNVGDLKGVFHVVFSEVRQEPPLLETDYCNGYVTAVFDGYGAMTITAGVNRCSVSGMHAEDGDYTYSVDPDGTVLVLEAGFTDPTHCKLLDKGKMLLCDGSRRNPAVLSWMGVGVKQ